MSKITSLWRWTPKTNMLTKPFLKAYIPLRRKNIYVGSLPWPRPPTQNFEMGVPTCWYLKMLKFAFPPTRNPNASQWNIGCVGSQTQISCVGHVHFSFYDVDFIRVGSHFSAEYGLKFDTQHRGLATGRQGLFLNSTCDTGPWQHYREF